MSQQQSQPDGDTEIEPSIAPHDGVADHEPSAVADRPSRGVAVALTLATLVVVAGLLLLPVRIDGRLTLLLRGTTVADLVREGRVEEVPGNLVSVNGRLLRVGAGALPAVSVNGKRVAAATLIGPGSRISSAHGPDRVEPVTTTTIETTQALRFVGQGPFESVEDSGTTGTAEVVVGSLTGEEVSRRVISPGTEMTIRREPAWPDRKEVALTFDDGPWPGSTDAVLAQLQAGAVKATFFMLGRQVKARPEMAGRVLAAGMEIGNHSYSHKYLARASHKLITSEIGDGAKAIQSVLGVKPAWYRPAGGSKNSFVFREAKRLGMRVVLWTIDPKDWKRPAAATIARRVLDRVRPGSVILMHDGGGDRSHTVEALEPIIRGLKARGYTMVTLSELNRPPGPTP
ncbi:MAG TPA: polysaccharide deacetylase family protein [Coriobacteriia bacterium]